MNIKNIFKGILISLSSLVVGFFAIAIPFGFFDELTSSQMTIMFATEIIVYFALGCVFLIFKDIENAQKQKARTKQQTKAEIKTLNTEWYDLVA